VLGLLRAMLNKAEEVGYRGDNPARGLKMFQETARDRFIQVGELEILFKALEAEPQLFRAFFIMSLLTGARKSNVLAMRWVGLDLTTAYWRMPETKGGTTVVVPLVAPAISILERRRESTSPGAYSAK